MYEGKRGCEGSDGGMKGEKGSMGQQLYGEERGDIEEVRERAEREGEG